MTTKNLEQMRQDIDSIDSKITDLFKERMETSLKIAKYKKDNGGRLCVQSFFHFYGGKTCPIFYSH